MSILTVKQVIEKLNKFPSHTRVLIGEPARGVLFADDESSDGLYGIENIALHKKEDGWNDDYLIIDFNSGDFDEEGNVDLSANFPHYIARISQE